MARSRGSDSFLLSQHPPSLSHLLHNLFFPHIFIMAGSSFVNELDRMIAMEPSSPRLGQYTVRFLGRDI